MYQGWPVRVVAEVPPTVTYSGWNRSSRVAECLTNLPPVSPHVLKRRPQCTSTAVGKRHYPCHCQSKSALWGWLLLGMLALLLSGCTLQRSLTTEPTPQFARECAPPPAPARLPVLKTEPQESEQLEPFSARFHRIAAAIGLLPLLRQSVVLEREQAAGKEGAQLELIRTRQQILARTVLAILEATSLAAVVRCEQARADELADSLATSQSRAHSWRP